jgi:hypothetical protein
MAIEIKHRFTGTVLFKSETAKSTREAVIEAVSAGANLARADLAGANLAGANLAGADLADANLAGADLADANLAGANLAGANLARADLAGADLAGADLAGANLARADLAGADLAGADLADANLAGANLAGADLAGADLAGADLAGARSLPAGTEAKDPPEPYDRNRAIDYAARAVRYRERHPDVPVVERLDSRILEAITTGGCTLEMGSWHQCETTHCRAGWAIHLAGEPGYALERRYSAEHAGRLIYLVSTGRCPHFFATNERALEDIRLCAAREQQPEGASA